MTHVPAFSTAADAVAAAHLKHKSGDTAAALAIYRSLPEMFPGKESAGLAATGLRVCGHWSEAVNLLEGAIAQFSVSPALVEALADAYLEIKDYPRAVAAIERYLAQVAHNAVMWTNLGRIHGRSGDWAAAERAFAHSLNLQPDNVDAVLDHGEALYHINRTEEAIAAYRHAIALKPEDARGYFKLGSALVLQPDPADGKAVLFRAIALDPSNAVALTNLAGYYHRVGNLQRAIGTARQAIELNADVVPAYITLGNVLLEAGDRDNAAAILRIAADLAPESVVLLQDLAIAENAVGNPRGAEKVLQRIIAIAPDNLEARHMLAAVNGEPVRSVPSGYSRQVFNRYAPRFDRMLTDSIRYRAPEEVAALLTETKPDPRAFKRFIDLGCGTGVVAAALVKKYVFERAVGVDIAERMVEISRRKDLYDEVIHSDAAELLAANAGGFDLVTAVDLFTYIGDLTPLMPVMAGALAPGGILAYSIEQMPEGRYKLQSNGRFAHAPKYVEELAVAQGLVPLASRVAVLRMEGGAEARGLIGLLQRR